MGIAAADDDDVDDDDEEEEAADGNGSAAPRGRAGRGWPLLRGVRLNGTSRVPLPGTCGDAAEGDCPAADDALALGPAAPTGAGAEEGAPGGLKGREDAAAAAVSLLGGPADRVALPAPSSSSSSSSSSPPPASSLSSSPSSCSGGGAVPSCAPNLSISSSTLLLKEPFDTASAMSGDMWLPTSRPRLLPRAEALRLKARDSLKPREALRRTLRSWERPLPGAAANVSPPS